MTGAVAERCRRCMCAAIAGAVAVLFVIAGASAQSGLATPRAAAEIFVKATAAGDADAIAALYAPDAVMLAPGLATISGRDAIRATFVRNFGIGKNVIAFDDIRSETGQDRAAVLWQWRSEITPASGATIRLTGRSLVYFKLVGGAWLISADMMHVTPVQ